MSDTMKSKQNEKDEFEKNILMIEPFYGGSHKQLIDILVASIPGCSLFSQSAKKWHWRARTSALHFSLAIPKNHEFRVLFCSSTLNLAELVALRPDLQNLMKIIYFHENQLVYPVRKQQDRDFQYGYNQILSCMVADVVVFNSEFNKTSFLNSIKNFFKLMPDYRPKGVEHSIAPKCKVLYFPMEFPADVLRSPRPFPPVDDCEVVLNIVWPHRWEHDKNPNLLFDVLVQLHERQNRFNVFILGESFADDNELFEKHKVLLADHIKHCGYLERKQDYFNILSKCDVVISTAIHEFFGVAMLEAVHCGCYPLCPNNLVYPEIFPTECLYSDGSDLLKRLENYCHDPNLVRQCKFEMDLDQYSWKTLKDSYQKLLQF